MGVIASSSITCLSGCKERHGKKECVSERQNREFEIKTTLAYALPYLRETDRQTMRKGAT